MRLVDAYPRIAPPESDPWWREHVASLGAGVVANGARLVLAAARDPWALPLGEVVVRAAIAAEVLETVARSDAAEYEPDMLALEPLMLAALTLKAHLEERTT